MPHFYSLVHYLLLLVGQVLFVGTNLPFVGIVVAFHNPLVEGTGELCLSEHFLAIQAVVFHHTTSMNDIGLGDLYRTLGVSSMLHVHCLKLNMLYIYLKLSFFLLPSDL